MKNHTKLFLYIAAAAVLPVSGGMCAPAHALNSPGTAGGLELAADQLLQSAVSGKDSPNDPVTIPVVEPVKGEDSEVKAGDSVIFNGRAYYVKYAGANGMLLLAGWIHDIYTAAENVSRVVRSWGGLRSGDEVIFNGHLYNIASLSDKGELILGDGYREVFTDADRVSLTVEALGKFKKGGEVLFNNRTHIIRHIGAKGELILSCPSVYSSDISAAISDVTLLP